MLQVNNIDVFYEDLQALWDVSLRVHRGEIVALIGANGAGKSTILQTVAGLLHPTRGSIVFNGLHLDKQPVHKAVEMGICSILEGRRIFNGMSVLQNLELGAFPPRVRKIRKQNLNQVYKIFPILETRKNQIAETLSGGEQQMLVIGRGLMSEPRLMLIDEVSPGLAPLITQEIFEVIKQLNRAGMTILLAEQNITFALEEANRGYVVDSGHIVGEGSTKELSADRKVKQAYLGLE